MPEKPLFARIWSGAADAGSILELVQLLGRGGVAVTVLGGIGVGVWSYLRNLPGPTVAIYAIVATCGIAFLAMLLVGAYRSRRATETSTPGPTTGAQPQLAETQDRTFRKETAVLDGHHYINCDFYDCMFQYDGGPYRVTACRIHGNRGIVSGTLAVMATFQLMEAIREGTTGTAKVVTMTVKKPQP
jgi:hypothetical protein